MKFLLDENIPPSLCDDLSKAGHETTHVHQSGLTGATDFEVVNFANEKQLCIITHDFRL